MAFNRYAWLLSLCLYNSMITSQVSVREYYMELALTDHRPTWLIDKSSSISLSAVRTD